MPYKNYILAALCILMLIVLPVQAQSNLDRVHIHDAPVNAQTGQIDVYASVLNYADPNSGGRPVTGLNSSTLTLKDNGRQLAADEFSVAFEPTGISVIVLIDTSGSMLCKDTSADCQSGGTSNPSRIEHAKTLLREFTERYLQPQDHIGILEFNTTVSSLYPLSPATDKGAIYNSYANLTAKKGANTALYMAISQAMDWLETSDSRLQGAVKRQQHLILVFSDGNDGYQQDAAAPQHVPIVNVQSRFAVRDYDTPLYGVGIDTAGKNATKAYNYEIADVAGLARYTKGQLVEFKGDNQNQVYAMYEQIKQLGNAYRLTYRPITEAPSHLLIVQYQGAQDEVTVASGLQSPRPDKGKTILNPPEGTQAWTSGMRVTLTTEISFPDNNPRPIKVRCIKKEAGQTQVTTILDWTPGSPPPVCEWTLPDPTDLYKDRPISFYVEVADSILTGQDAVRSEEKQIIFAAAPTPVPTATPIPTATPEPTSTPKPKPIEVVGKAGSMWLPWLLLIIVAALVVLFLVFRKTLMEKLAKQGPGKAAPKTQVLSAIAAPKAKLVVLRGMQPGAEYLIRDSMITIGREQDCQFVVLDPYISRRHATIREQGGQFVLIDEGSGNGTLLNGAKIQPRMQYPLQPGSRIQIGDTIIEFQAMGSLQTQLFQGQQSGSAAGAAPTMYPPSGAGMPGQPGAPGLPSIYPQQPGGPTIYPQQPGVPPTYPQQPGGSTMYPQQPGVPPTYPQQPGNLPGARVTQVVTQPTNNPPTNPSNTP